MSEQSLKSDRGDPAFEARSTHELVTYSARLQPNDHCLEKLRNKLQRRYLRLSECVASLVLHRSQTHNGWQYCADARTFHEESLQALHEELAKGSSDGPSSMAGIDSLKRQAAEDLEMLLARSQDTKAQEERRIALEGRFGSLQQSFMMAVNEFMYCVNGQVTESKIGQEHDQSTSVDGSIEGEQLPAEVDPLLEKYYDRAGELRLLGERLAELDYAYQEAVAESQLLGDQGMTVELANADREKEYLQQRIQLEVALDATILESDELKRLCVAQGLLPLQDQMVDSTNIIVADEGLQSSTEADLEAAQLVGRPDDVLMPPKHGVAAIGSQTDRLTENSAPMRRPRPDMAQSRHKVAAWIESTDLEPPMDLPTPSLDEMRIGIGKLGWLLDSSMSRSYDRVAVRLRRYSSMPELR